MTEAQLYMYILYCTYTDGRVEITPSQATTGDADVRDPDRNLRVTSVVNPTANRRYK